MAKQQLRAIGMTTQWEMRTIGFITHNSESHMWVFPGPPQLMSLQKWEGRGGGKGKTGEVLSEPPYIFWVFYLLGFP